VIRRPQNDCTPACCRVRTRFCGEARPTFTCESPGPDCAHSTRGLWAIRRDQTQFPRRSRRERSAKRRMDATLTAGRIERHNCREGHNLNARSRGAAFLPARGCGRVLRNAFGPAVSPARNRKRRCRRGVQKHRGPGLPSTIHGDDGGVFAALGCSCETATLLRPHWENYASIQKPARGSDGAAGWCSSCPRSTNEPSKKKKRRQVVPCYTCHRGSNLPKATPSLRAVRHSH